MEKKIPLYTIDVCSTDFCCDAYFDGSGNRYSIRYHYCKDQLEYRSGISFFRMLSLRQRAESCCTAWHIENAYDALVEIEGSRWKAELENEIPLHLREPDGWHHYMIYLDSAGCFEIIAKSWTVIPEEKVKP